MGDSGSKKEKRYIKIFTDLDGTLLDHYTYKWDEAKPALDLCRKYHIPVIMVSSKTRAELDVIRGDMGFSAPYISENGGGIFFPPEWSEDFPPGTVFADNVMQYPMGISSDQIVKMLYEIREELKWVIKGFSEMTPEEITDLTDLDLKGARLAKMREFDEPFIIEMENPDMDELSNAAMKRGLRISTGGRFLHLHGKNDKGIAVKRLIDWYKVSQEEIISIGLGDSPNDFSMLKNVDKPVLVRSKQSFPGIEEAIPGLIITQEPGPKGWNSAVLDLLRTKHKGEFF